MTTDLREEVRERYAAAALAAGSGGCGCTDSGGCCGNVACDGEDASFGEALYSVEERAQVPGAAALASLGCGNPTAVAALHEGETVLDLGSGGGLDVILSARRVGETGLAFGLDRARAPAGRADRDLRRRRRGPAHAGRAWRAGQLRRLHRRRALEGRVRGGLAAAGFDAVSVEYTHGVADGMHGAVVKAVKR